MQEKVVLGRQERDSPANNVALCVKLGIQDAGQMGCQVLLAHLQTPGEMNGRERLSRLGHGAHDLPAGHMPFVQSRWAARRAARVSSDD